VRPRRAPTNNQKSFHDFLRRFFCIGFPRRTSLISSWCQFLNPPMAVLSSTPFMESSTARISAVPRSPGTRTISPSWNFMICHVAAVSLYQPLPQFQSLWLRIETWKHHRLRRSSNTSSLRESFLLSSLSCSSSGEIAGRKTDRLAISAYRAFFAAALTFFQRSF